MTQISLRRRNNKSNAPWGRAMKMIMGTASVVVYLCYHQWTKKTPEPEIIVVPPTEKENQLAISHWFSGIDGDDVIDCDVVAEYVETGTWIDPNQGYAYFRQPKTKPQFYVSLHHNERDISRWENIFEKGDDYAQRTRKNMEYILSESNAHWKSAADNTLPVVVDVGANVGMYTFLAAAWKHAVVAFEIDPIHVIRLCESMRFNRIPWHVRIHRQCASTVSDSTLNIETVDEERGDDASGRKFSVSTVTLDEFATQRNWFERKDLHIALLKVDTGGFELQVLQGARKFIKRQLAKNLILDFFGTSCREAAMMLLKAGYVVVDDATHSRRMLSRQESELVVDAISANDYVLNIWFRLSHLPLT